MQGPLTPKFDRATQPFLRFNTQHIGLTVYFITDRTFSKIATGGIPISQNRLFKVDRNFSKMATVKKCSPFIYFLFRGGGGVFARSLHAVG